MTLAATLELAKTLAAELRVIEDEIISESKDKSFQGHDLYPMTSNKMLYYIATDQAMLKTVAEFADEYEVEDYDRLKFMCRLDNKRSDRIRSMKGIISLRVNALKLKEEIQAVNDYLETFDAVDFRRIKKEQSIAILKAMKLV